MPVPNQVSERICVLEVSILPLATIFLFHFRIFRACFHFIRTLQWHNFESWKEINEKCSVVHWFRYHWLSDISFCSISCLVVQKFSNMFLCICIHYYSLYNGYKKRKEDIKGVIKSVNWRTDNTVAKKGQTTIYKTLHRKLTMESTNPTKNRGRTAVLH